MKYRVTVTRSDVYAEASAVPEWPAGTTVGEATAIRKAERDAF